MKILLLPILLALSGCVTATLNCPASGPPVQVTINGPNIITIAESIISVLGAAGVLAEHRPQPSPPINSVGTVTYRGLNIFGSQTITCGPIG